MKIKVGPIFYTVEELERVDEDNSFGEVQYTPCRIRLKLSLAPQCKRLTLWQELIHIILVQAGYREHDERMIEILSCGIMEILQDNPFLRA